MNKRPRLWILLAVYLTGVAGGFLLMAFGGLGVSWNIFLAMVLVTFTAFVSYAIAHPKKK